MAGKYRRLLRPEGKQAELSPLRRKVDRQGAALRALQAKVETAVAELAEAAGVVAAAAPAGKPEDPELWFVTRAELREAVESGEVPQAWLDAPAAETPEDPAP